MVTTKKTTTLAHLFGEGLVVPLDRLHLCNELLCCGVIRVSHTQVTPEDRQQVVLERLEVIRLGLARPTRPMTFVTFRSGFVQRVELRHHALQRLLGAVRMCAELLAEPYNGLLQLLYLPIT